MRMGELLNPDGTLNPLTAVAGQIKGRVAVDPDHHIVDFENERVRVVRMTYPPGSKTPLHAHRQGFGVFLSDAHGRNISETGDPIPIDFKAGSTFWTTGLPVHVTENLGDADLVVLLVEMKLQPAGGS